MKCPKCSFEKFTGPVYVQGLYGTEWNQYRCANCGFSTHQPCDDDAEERRLLVVDPHG
jgi:uncharacterized Zn finger protein